MEKSLSELAVYLDGRVIGAEDTRITGISGLDEAGEGDITFLGNVKYAQKVATTGASAVILPPGVDPCGKNAIEVANPYLAFAKVLNLFHVHPPEPKGVMEGACIGKGVTMGTGVTVCPGAYVGDGARIGDRVTLFPGVVLYDGVVLGDDVTLHANVSVRERCRIGNRVIVHCGTVIGSDGFGYAPDGKGWYKIPQMGIVVIEDDVEIGANSTIDRAALEVTLIKRGTKIDNLVQVAHNCIIGENCMIASQAGISGSSKLGDHVTLAGQVGIVGHLKIGDNVLVGGKSGVTDNLPAGSLVSGIPAFPHRDWLRVSAIIPRLPELRKTVSTLEKKIRELEEKLAAQ
ncbi:MAG TPA: UDP-3-O-(3-hydroxymyristoyl)glucosamine N-acyltransferase [Geobacteraceae bacterium]|nr:UDP-3-O-(3-hydroxymyristoyl)glucosamine N-acyltransferase [Geobacteraceae bacterium]